MATQAKEVRVRWGIQFSVVDLETGHIGHLANFDLKTADRYSS
jgi:hypothetical protein